MMQFRDASILRRDIYTDGVNYSYDFLSLCKKDMTFDEDFFTPKFRPGARTPFKEIRFAIPEEVINTEYSYLIKNHSKEQKLEEYFINLRKAIKRYLRETLRPGEKYLQLHSGGWDSRIISCAIAELRDEGLKINIHFLCSEPECETFRRIMKMERWSDSDYTCFTPKGDNPFHIGFCNVNGWASYVQSMKFWNVDEKQYNLIYGWGGEAAMYIYKYRKLPQVHCENKMINALWEVMIGRQWEGSFRMRFKDLILPFFSYHYLDNAWIDPKFVKISTFDRHRDNIRREFLKYWNYPLHKIGYSVEGYDWMLSEHTKKNIMESYYNSEFYRIYRKEIDPFDNWSGLDGQILGFAGTFQQLFIF